MRGRGSKLSVLALALLIVGALAYGAGPASAAVPTGNLLQNPGAESGAGSTDSGCGSGGTTPGWTGTTGFTAVQYGTTGYPDQTVSSAINGGSNFFTGGCASGADAGQIIDLSAYAADIDAGHIQLTLSGYLGGYLNQEDNAQVRVDFVAGDSNFGHVTIGPVTAADRNNQTTLLLRQAQAMIPAGTRALNVDMKFTRFSGTDDDGSADNLSVSLTDTSLPPPPSNATPPVISGQTTVGQTVACSTGTWSNNPTGYAFQWLLDGHPLSGQTSSTHTIASTEAGHQLACRVTAANAGGSASATSGPVTPTAPPPGSPVNTSLPVISGTPDVGQTLSCSTGAWTNNPTGYGYQWLLDGLPLAGQTSSRHLIGAGEAGRSLSCRVTATNATGSASATSAAVLLAGGGGGSAPAVNASVSPKPRAHLPFTVNPAGSTPGTGTFVSWRYAFIGLNGRPGNNVVACPGNAPVLTAVLSGRSNATLLVTAINSAGLSTTTRVPLGVASFATNGAGVARAGSQLPSLVSAACSPRAPQVSTSRSHGHTVKRFSLGCPSTVHAGLIDAYGCFDEVTDLSQLPKLEGLYLAKHAKDFKQFFGGLYFGGGTDADTYFVAHGAIKVNGLTVDPVHAGHPVIAVGGKSGGSFEKQNAAYLVSTPGRIQMTAPGGVPLPLFGPVPGVVDMEVTSDQPVVNVAQLDTAKLANSSSGLVSLPAIPWLKLTGTLNVRWARCDEGALLKEYAASSLPSPGDTLSDCNQSNSALPGITLIDANMALPGMFGLLTGKLTASTNLFADNSQGVVLNGIWGEYQGTQTLGPVNLTDVKLTYTRSDDTLAADVTAKLLTGQGGDLHGRLEFVHGDPHLHLEYACPGGGFPCGIPIVPDLVNLTKASIDVPDPPDNAYFGGQIDLAFLGVADSGGNPLAGYHGRLTINEPEPGDIFPFSMSGNGQMTFLGQPWGNTQSFYVGEHGASFSSGFRYAIGSLMDIQAGVTGSVAFTGGAAHVQVDGLGSAALSVPSGIPGAPAFSQSGSGEVVVSDQGTGFCLNGQGLFGVHAGIGIHYTPAVFYSSALFPPPWGPTELAAYVLSDPAHNLTVQGDTCNIDQYRSIHGNTAPDARRARAAASSFDFAVPAGQRVAIARLVGAADAPSVTLHGPGGRTFDVTGTQPVNTPTEYAFRVPGAHTTMVYIGGANAGRWTIAPDPGSTPIIDAESSHELGPVTITGRITGHGAHRVLRYRARNLPAGARLAFEELGSNGAIAPIGHSTRAAGALRFIPDAMTARRRTIIAVVTRSDGTALPSVTVTRYATTPPMPGPVRGLRARRAGSTLRISFRPSALATGYVLAVSLRDGRRLMFALGARRHSLGMRSFPRTDRVLAISVWPIRDGRYGLIARARSPGRI